MIGQEEEDRIPRDPDYYTDDEIDELLLKAHALGYSLDPGSELEELTIRQLEVLVMRIQ